MILDSEKQRSILLALIESAQFTGSSIDDMYIFKQEVMNAEVKDESIK